jgi:LacI family transcriptional regulator
LPRERPLSRTLQASRNSLRTALLQLKTEGLIKPDRGRGHRVLSPRSGSAKRPSFPIVGVLTPEPIGSLRPLIALWIDELRELLPAHGYRLRVHSGRHFYSPHPSHALERLANQEPCAAWILTLSSEAMQRWFARAGGPTLVAGSVYPGIDLPSLDIDHQAVCRHAVGTLLRLGHRRLALLTREPRRPGDLASERGFLEGVRQSRQAGVDDIVVCHREDTASVTSAIDRLLKRRAAPTALVVCNSYIYLTVQSVLAQRGLRVPGDISLISRDDDPFLRFLAPPPARYVITPSTFARRLLHHVLQLAERRPPSSRHSLILPKFCAGSSTAPYPPASQRGSMLQPKACDRLE